MTIRQFFRSEIPFRINIYPIIKEQGVWKKTGQKFFLYTKNITPTGCMIRHKSCSFPSSYVLLEFIVDWQDTFNWICAKIAWSRIEPLTNKETICSFGLRFLIADPKLQDKILGSSLCCYPVVYAE